MSIDILPNPAPCPENFIPLSEHQTQTPSSFFGGLPVLHYYLPACDVLISRANLQTYEVFNQLSGGRERSNVPESFTHGAAGGSEQQDEQEKESAGQEHAQPTVASLRIEDVVVLEYIEVFVTSQSLILSPFGLNESDETWQPHSNYAGNPAAISIPYPAISLHALQRLSQQRHGEYPNSKRTYRNDNDPIVDSPEYDDAVHIARTKAYSVYLQLDPQSTSQTAGANGGTEAMDPDDSEPIEVLIVPKAVGQNVFVQAPNGFDKVTKDFFDALSNCADLHPDSGEEGLAEDGAVGGLAGVPGGGGWITSENAHEFEGRFGDDGDVEQEEVVEEGNVLGPGAGRRRARNEVDEDGVESNSVNGHTEEETKWQRTG